MFLLERPSHHYGVVVVVDVYSTWVVECTEDVIAAVVRTVMALAIGVVLFENIQMEVVVVAAAAFAACGTGTHCVILPMVVAAVAVVADGVQMNRDRSTIHIDVLPLHRWRLYGKVRMPVTNEKHSVIIVYGVHRRRRRRRLYLLPVLYLQILEVAVMKTHKKKVPALL